MAPIPNLTSAPSELLHTILQHIGLQGIHRHPEYEDVIDPPGEIERPIGGGTGPPRSGIFIVIIVFGLVAVIFTIVAGCIWCAAANELIYSSEQEERRPWRAKKVAPLKEWYRRRRNFPRTKSDISRDFHRHSILESLSVTNWRVRTNRRCEPEYTYKAWRRAGPKDSDRSPLFHESRGGYGYSTFSKEEGSGGAHILSLSVPTSPHMEQLFAGHITGPVPPLRRPPLGSTKTAPMSRLPPIDRVYRDPRSNSWSGSRGRRCKYSGREYDGSGRGYSWGNGGRGGSRGACRNKPPGMRGLDVVQEEEYLSEEQK